MLIHHIDCASLCPLGRRFINGDGSLFERGVMPAHCLLIETDRHGLVLIDTGIGDQDVQDPSRLGALFSLVGAPGRSGKVTTARAHVEALGFSPKDVRHVIVTHLDLDHAGGLPDFPEALIHVHEHERAAILKPSWRERERYRACHFAHGPRFVTYRAEGEAWRGFPCVRRLESLPPEIFAIPLPGHTRGHWCIGVSAGTRTLLHCGDGYFHRSAVRAQEPAAPSGLAAFERIVAMDWPKVVENHARLRELTASGADLDVFCAHDPVELERLQQRAI